MPILANALISTQRPGYSAGTKATQLPGTTTTAPVTAGNAVSIPVVASASLSVNQVLLIDTPTSGAQELATCTSIPDGTHVVATLARNHASGVPVVGTYLSNVVATVDEIDQVGYTRLVPLGEGALSAEYQIVVDTGTDIAIHDRIVSIARLRDGVTWPAEMPTASTIWLVVYVRETAPGFLAERLCFVKRDLGGGPVHP